MRTRSAALLLISALAITPLAGQARFTKQDADRFQSKLAKIVQLGNAAAIRAAAPQSTPVSDVEVNSYLRFHAADQIPVGILEPTLNALGDGEFHRFEKLFDASEGTRGVVVTFLAMLELAKEQLIEIVQEESLAPIYVKSLATAGADEAVRRDSDDLP